MIGFFRNRAFWAAVFGLWVVFLIVHTAFSEGGGPQLFWNIDKVKHFAYFASGAFALALAQAKPTIWTVVGTMVLAGSAHEFWQMSIPGRHADIFDLLADTAGALFAFYISRRLAP